jgi:hypothetical protein
VRRFHVSVACLMAVMISIALGLAALHEATQVRVNIVFNLVVAALLIATYEAKRHKGVAGAGWASFASFGWAQLVLGLIGMPEYVVQGNRRRLTNSRRVRPGSSARRCGGSTDAIANHSPSVSDWRAQRDCRFG